MSIVSVIVPVYKVENYLDKCITSIQQQTCSDIEIILVDDGSPDKCGIMCDMYADKDSRIVTIHKKNGGLSDARNEGIEKATGKYLLFVDSDDWIDENLIERTVEVAEKNQADVVMFDYMSVDEETNVRKTFSMSLEENTVLSAEKEPRLISKSCSACNKLFRKEFWKRNNLKFPVGKHYEDLGTIPKLLGVASKVVYLKETLYFYLQRGGSIMHSTDFFRNYKDRTEMLDSVLLFYKEKGLLEKYRKELEYLVFENGYFIPSKEIVLNDRKNPCLLQFKKYALEKFPCIYKNPYIKELSTKDKILYRLLRIRMYGVMIALSKCRQIVNKNG